MGGILNATVACNEDSPQPCFLRILCMNPCSLPTMLGQDGAPKRMPVNTVITRRVCLLAHKGVLPCVFFVVIAHCLYIEQTIP